MERERAPETLAVAIAGFMGVGKSSVGKAVAHGLRRAFFDTDQIVVERLGRSIAELFRAGEEPLFRAAEAAAVAELVALQPPVVLALGGGALEHASTRQLLSERAIVVHLDLPWATISSELPSLEAERPLLRGRGETEIRTLYDARRAHYLAAPLQVPVGREGPQIAADAVLSALAAVGISPPPKPTRANE